MRYILYLFTLALVFVGGMLVGNIYLPERSSSVAAAISVPDAQSAHPAIAAATLDVAQRNLRILNDALNSCPVVVGEEKERLIHQIDLFWARQDFDLKKARYELEIAKNTPGTAVTSRFAQASADYSAALKRVEKMAQDYFPQPQEEKVAEKPAKQAETPAKQAETPAKQAETPAKQAEIPAKNIAPAKTAAPKQAEEKAPAKKAQQAEPTAVTQAQTPAEPQGAPTQETVAQETRADELKTAAVNAPKDAEKPQTATAQETEQAKVESAPQTATPKETEQAKTETDKAPLANSTPETPAETATQAKDGTAPQATATAQEKTAAAPQEQAPQTAETATRQENANQAAETTAQKAPDLPAPNEQGSTAPQAQPTEPKN